jgi:type IV secretory pathway VirB3-like protein
MARTAPRHVSSRALIPGHLVSLHYRNPSFYGTNTYSMVNLTARLSHLGDLMAAQRARAFSISHHERGCQEKQMLGMKRNSKTNHVIVGFTSPAFVERIDKSLHPCMFMLIIIIIIIISPSISTLQANHSPLTTTSYLHPSPEP